MSNNVTTTEWRDPWGAWHRFHRAMVGAYITRQINNDPAEMERLQRSREQIATARPLRRRKPHE